jgi:NADPH:quinone reductase-like Zn-dependent oxidoreductase
LKTPKVLGSDFCGTVIKSRSSRFKEGDDIFGFLSAVKGGAYAEEVVVNEDYAALKPANLSYTVAAVLPLVASTAFQGLFNKGNLKPGMRVLVSGCTGGVGSAAVQIAKSVGATVTGTCSENHFDFARQLGCDEVLDYKKPLPQSGDFDIFFDVHGSLHFDDAEKSLNKKGIFVSTRGGTDSFSGVAEAAKDVLFESRSKLLLAKPNFNELDKLRALVEQGKLKSYVARTFPLSQLKDAHLMMENESFTGKIAIEI